MKIIISPAKKMRSEFDDLPWEQLPKFHGRAQVILDHLRSHDTIELQKIWQCNDSITALNEGRVHSMDLKKQLTPALLSYEGLQYQYMAPHVFDVDQWRYVKEHLVILSGFYGMLRPTDGVCCYRLEMQAKFDNKIDGVKNLYHFWGRSIYDQLTAETSIILNLASKEYSKVVEKYADDAVRVVTCVFGTLVADKVKVKATEAKMARGEMVRFLASHQIKTLEGVKRFNSLDFVFDSERSTENNYVFIKHKKTTS